MKLKATRLLNTTIVFLLAAPIVVIFYSLYVYNPANADNWLMYSLLLVADTIGILVVLSLWLTILMDVLVPEHHHVSPTKTAKKFLKTNPSVDMLITAAGEPKEIIETTLRAALAVSYPHQTFILDDGNSDELRQLCHQLGAVYVTRTQRQHAKAGNVNNGLLQSQAEFFVILDADQVPKPNFIDDLIIHMADPEVAMVQAPQYFTNTHNFIAQGSAHAQEIFYKYVCPARNISNSVFCVGTNVMFRRTAINQIGGIAKLDHSEDIWTSYQLHHEGWKTLFVNDILTTGLAPTTIESYSRQQLRWAKGGFSMLFYRNPLFSDKLSLDQKIQYFSSNFFYLVGISMVLYAFFPIAYLLFDIKPLDTDNGFLWLIHYLPYVALYYSLTWLLLGKMYISSIAVSLSTFYPYILALVSTLFGTEQQWVATSVGKKKNDFLFKWIWPHILLILLTISALFVGWYYPSDFWVAMFYSILASWNIYLLGRYVTANASAVTI